MNKDNYEDTIERAANCLATVWAAEDAGEHADTEAKWYRHYVDELVADGYSRGGVVSDVRARALRDDDDWLER